MKTIAIIGGTGKEGRGLAYRWVKAGHEVVIGSRSLEKAEAAVNEMNKILPLKFKLQGETNEKAATQCEIIVITVPYTAHQEILSTLQNVISTKLVIDVTVPIVPPQVTKVHIPHAGSAALEAQKILGSNCKIASAFHNVSYDLLLHDNPIECDVLVSGTDDETIQATLKLVRDAGLQGWDAGSLENSIVAESLTSVLIYLNKKYKTQHAGIKITGINH